MVNLLSFSQEQIEPLLVSSPGRVGFAATFLGETYSFKGDESFVAASTIKLPLLLSALKLNLQKPVPLPLPKTGGSGILEYFNSNLYYNLHDLLLAMVAISDNAATNVVIDLLGGFQPILREWTLWGLKKTKLQRKMMDYSAREKGLENTSSPLEMVNLLTALTPEKTATLRYFLSKQLFVEGLGFYLREGVTEHKTGSLDSVFNDVGIMNLNGDLLYYAYFSEDINVGESITLAGRIGQIIYERCSL